MTLRATGIAAIGLLYRYARVNAILAFWAAYIVTRPLGASIGDFLSQPRHPEDPTAQKGLGLGTNVTSLIFLGLIAVVVIVMTIDQRREPVLIEEEELAA